MISRKTLFVTGLLCLVMGQFTGYIIGQQQARMKEKRELTFYLLGKVKSDLHTQQDAAGEAYRNADPLTAIGHLEALLKAYDREARFLHSIQTTSDEVADLIAFPAAVTHARLFKLHSALGHSDEAQAHLLQAAKWAPDRTMEELLTLLDAIDKAESAR